MKYLIIVILVGYTTASCTSKLEKYGQHYQNNKDIESLEKAVALIDIGTDTAYIKQILGKPIDFGFDIRYTTESYSENGCPIGAVFHIDEHGKIDQKWVDEICE